MNLNFVRNVTFPLLSSFYPTQRSITYRKSCRLKMNITSNISCSVMHITVWLQLQYLAQRFHWSVLFNSGIAIIKQSTTKQTPWPQSVSLLYRPTDRRSSTKLVPTSEDKGCRVVSATDSHGRMLGFLDRSRYLFFKVAPQLYSRDWADPVPDWLLLRKSGSAGNRSRTSGSVARNSDH
jgi:hypothetical protein